MNASSSVAVFFCYKLTSLSKNSCCPFPSWTFSWCCQVIGSAVAGPCLIQCPFHRGHGGKMGSNHSLHITKKPRCACANITRQPNYPEKCEWKLRGSMGVQIYRLSAFKKSCGLSSALSWCVLFVESVCCQVIRFSCGLVYFSIRFAEGRVGK